MVSRKTAARQIGVALALALGSTGCDAPSPRCGTLNGCDIRSEACQRHALRYAVCLRGRDESPELDIPVEMLSRADFVDAWVAAAEADEADDTARDLRRGLTLLALRSADSDVARDARRRAKRVAATYSYDPPHITIVDDGRRLDGSYIVTLVHEYVHALQHASGDTDLSVVPERFDDQLARSALLEGEATILDDETYLQGVALDFDQARYTRALRTYRESASRFYLPDRDDVLGALYGRFTYAFGASYLWELRQRDGLAAVATAFETPPVSTYAVMRLDPKRPDQRENDLGEDAVPVLPDLTLRATRHLGRFAYGAFAHVFEPYGFTLDLPADASFVADTLSVFSSADDVVLAVWRIRFDEADAVSALVDRWRTEGEDAVRLRQDGDDLLILASEDGALLDTLPEELTFEAAGDDFFSESELSARGRVTCEAHEPF